MRTRPNGFTLIELLVVISIIALLLGILLPTLGEAKRRARMALDVANLSMHGKAIGIYSAENRGRMPNIPEGRGTLETGGPRSMPKGWFANRNGDQASGPSPSGNSSAAHNGFAFLAGGLVYDDVWRFHNIAFGDYIVDGEGFDLLNDVFASPGSDIGENYQIIKEGTDPDLTFPGAFLGLSNGNAVMQGGGAGGIPRDWFNDSSYGGDDDPPNRVTPPGNYMWMLQSSYRYTFSALYGSLSGSVIVNAGGLAQNFFVPNEFTGQDAWQTSVQSYSTWRAYIQQTEFLRPSGKVAFWQFDAVNSPRARDYFLPFAEVAVATVDGAARLVKPFEVMPEASQAADAYLRRSGWGTVARYSGTWNPTPEDLLGISGNFGTKSFAKPFAWFIHTTFGPRGVDLAGGDQ